MPWAKEFQALSLKTTAPRSFSTSPHVSTSVEALIREVDLGNSKNRWHTPIAEVHRASFKSRLIRFHSRSGNWANGCERIFRISRVGPHANGFRLVPCIAFKYTFRA